MPLMISPIVWVSSAGWLLAVFAVWHLRGRRVREAMNRVDAMRYEIAELESSRKKISVELAERVRSEIQQSQYDEYTAFVPKLQALSNFMNREFPADMKSAQLHRPPLHVFEVIQNLLVEYRGGKKPHSAGKVSA